MKNTFFLHDQPNVQAHTRSRSEAAQIIAGRLFAKSKKSKLKFQLVDKKNKIFNYIGTKTIIGGSPQIKITDLPEDLTIKFASKTTLQSLKLLNITSKSYRTQLKPLLTTHEHKNQFHMIDENAGNIMKQYSVTLKDILNSSIHIDFFDRFIYAFTITRPNDQCKYIYETLFDYTDDAKPIISMLLTSDDISKSSLKQLKFKNTIFGAIKTRNYFIDYRIFQFLSYFADNYMKDTAKLIMKISLIKQLMIFLGRIYLDKIIQHYPFLAADMHENILEDINVLLESYIFHKKLNTNIQHFGIFFFYVYSVIATAIIFDYTVFDHLSDSQKYSIKKGMIYDMIYYIKPMYGDMTQHFTILCLFNIYYEIEKDKYLKFFIFLILCKYIINSKVKIEDIEILVSTLSKSIKTYMETLDTFELQKIGLSTKKEIDVEIKKDILEILGKRLESI